MIKLLKGFDIRVRIMSAEHKHHRFCGTVIGSYDGVYGRVCGYSGRAGDNGKRDVNTMSCIVVEKGKLEKIDRLLERYGRIQRRRAWHKRSRTDGKKK